MQGVFLDFATVSNNDVATARLDAALPELEYFEDTRQEELVDRVKSAEVILTNKVSLTAETFAAASDLRLVVLAATGTDNVDLAAAKAAGIAVYNIRDYCTASVVQHVFALILSLTRHLSAYQHLLQTCAWHDSPRFCLLDYAIRELDDKVLGIVGYGNLGQAVANAARAFGMRVLVAQRPGIDDDREGRVPLEDLLGSADIISLHCPLTAATRGLIGQAELDLMKEDALIINTARGALLDEEALAMALRAGRLGGAGIDVLSEEPPVHGNPLLTGRIPNLIITPHVAWAAREARQRAVDAMAENIERFGRGDDTHRVA